MHASYSFVFYAFGISVAGASSVVLQVAFGPTFGRPPRDHRTSCAFSGRRLLWASLWWQVLASCWSWSEFNLGWFIVARLTCAYQNCRSRWPRRFLFICMPIAVSYLLCVSIRTSSAGVLGGSFLRMMLSLVERCPLRLIIPGWRLRPLGPFFRALG